MKNILKSRQFLCSVLAVACIGILVTCLVAGRQQKNDFKPEVLSETEDARQNPAAPASTVKSGSETHTGIAADTPVPAAVKEPDPLAEYPKVTEETGDRVIVDFTPDSEELKPEPPAPPTTNDDTTDPSTPPVYTPEETEPEVPAPPVQDNTPAPGSTNGNGAVYDPVFGWVVPGNVEQSQTDSNGDPDKMVGDM